MQNFLEKLQVQIDLWLSQLLNQPSGLLSFCLLVSGLNSVVFYGVYQPAYDHEVNLLAACIFFLLIPWARNERYYKATAHAFLTTAFLLVSWITFHTGGINSPAMVWMTVLAVPALLLLGHREAFFWMGMVVASCVFQLMSIRLGWAGAAVEMGTQTVAWAWLDKVGVTLSLILAIHLYARMHDMKIREVDLRNAQLVSAQQSLLKARSHKDQFLASVGDELRAPVSRILGLNGTLVEALGSESERVNIARQVGLSAERLLHLVNGILDFACLQSGKLSLRMEAVHLRRLVDGVLSQFADQMAGKSLSMTLVMDPQLPVWIETDAQRLSQVLMNLMDNAVKFTDHGGVAVRVSLQSGQLRVEVEDTGRGIAPSQQQQVFNSFEQSDVQTNRTYGGTGLGLAICEKLVALSGGQIGVSSALGQGAVFWFVWPFEIGTGHVVSVTAGSAS